MTEPRYPNESREYRDRRERLRGVAEPSGKLVNWSGSDLFRIAGGTIIERRFLDDMLQSLQIQGNEHD